MNTFLCPVCGKDSNAIEPIAEMRVLLKKYGSSSGINNPGGVEYFFPFGRIQVSGYCNFCDLEKIRNQIKELKKRQ